MPPSTYLPIFELTRGETVESIHYGAVSVVNAHGQLVASFGNPQATTYLRSSAKPFQAIPFIEHNGKAQFNLSQREI
ncbi:MAG: asparaginase, partial [Anaerolineales bacterium]|nr:asparaginase [Anaerolineales bacterium]